MCQTTTRHWHWQSGLANEEGSQADVPCTWLYVKGPATGSGALEVLEALKHILFAISTDMPMARRAHSKLPAHMRLDEALDNVWQVKTAHCTCTCMPWTSCNGSMYCLHWSLARDAFENSRSES